MPELLGHEYGFDWSRAMALASVAVDLRVTQIVSGVRRVHAVFQPHAVSGL